MGGGGGRRDDVSYVNRKREREAPEQNRDVGRRETKGRKRTRKEKYGGR